MIEYIHEFHRVVVRLRHWPEQLLIQLFCESLSRDLFQLCLARGILNQLDDWYQLVAVVEVELMLCKYGESSRHCPKKTQERWPLGRNMSVAAVDAPARQPECTPILCFCCSQEGHCAAMCPAPVPLATLAPPAPVETEKAAKKGEGEIKCSD